jgi:hypothetical protein
MIGAKQTEEAKILSDEGEALWMTIAEPTGPWNKVDVKPQRIGHAAYDASCPQELDSPQAIEPTPVSVLIRILRRPGPIVPRPNPRVAVVERGTLSFPGAF